MYIGKGPAKSQQFLRFVMDNFVSMKRTDMNSDNLQFANRFK